MQPNKQHIVLVAGEESGDFHAASLVDSLLKMDPSLSFSGMGGHHLKNKGVEVIDDLSQYGIVGISSVFKHFFTIKKAFRRMEQHLRDVKPDLLILIDYPGFNLRLARFAKEQLGIKILYYISPQIWAWKKNRIKIIQKYVDVMAVILPFEKKIYQDAGITSYFVGHPLAETLASKNLALPKEILASLPPYEKMIAILPGSRPSEIHHHMPVISKVIQKINKLHPEIIFVLPVAKTLSIEYLKKYIPDNTPITLIEEHALELMNHADAVVVASGTASFECALLLKPMIIIYKVSLLTYVAATQLIQVPYLGLCNLLMNSMTVPELLQDDFNEQSLFDSLMHLLSDTKFQDKITTSLSQMKKELLSSSAEKSLSSIVLEMVK